jgi:hypothetical protein
MLLSPPPLQVQPVVPPQENIPNRVFSRYEQRKEFWDQFDSGDIITAEYQNKIYYCTIDKFATSSMYGLGMYIRDTKHVIKYGPEKYQYLGSRPFEQLLYPEDIVKLNIKVVSKMKDDDHDENLRRFFQFTDRSNKQ